VEGDVDENRQSAGRFAPTAGNERLTAIDTLRGVAVLGILVMNIYGFAMSFAAYANPLAWGGTEWYNLGTWFFTHILFDQKFMTIFSLLFGGGLVLMATRAESRGASFTGTWYRRSLWLLLIGALHGYFVWFGDILFHYALMGMLIFPFRNLAPRSLIIFATVLLSLGLLMSFAGGSYMKRLSVSGQEVIELRDAGEPLTDEQQAVLDEWEEASMFMKPPDQQVEEDTAAYTGSYGEIVRYRAPMVATMQTQGTIGFVLWRVGGLMLLGMALMKLGILSGQRDDSVYRRIMRTGYGLGIPIVLFSAWNLQAHQWDFLWMFRIGNLPNYIGSILVALGHIGLVMLVIRRGYLGGLMERFTAVGRMAITNYLMHSLILTTVFYGYGLGLYGQVPRAAQMLFVIAVIGFQLWFSRWWLARFRFGPMEWLWRSLTYWQAQPMTRA
jgi:uncharacterized protein